MNMDKMPTDIPSLDQQRRFWDEWNQRFRTRGIDTFMSRQLESAIEWVHHMEKAPLAVAEIGCGNGWLVGRLAAAIEGEFWGIDISPASIAAAAEAHPKVHFACVDAIDFRPGRKMDVVISADAIAHIPDQAGLIRRISDMLTPRGRLILMTQNPFVWNRSSYLMPPGEGQFRDWPPLPRLRQLLAKDFRIVRVTSIVPGGDQGIPGVINSRWVSGVAGRLIGRQLVDRIKERMLIGREYVIVADRR